MKKRIKKVIAFFLVWLLGWPLVSFADTIYLKDGSVIEGKILEITEHKIKIETSYGEVIVWKNRVVKIEYPSPAVKTKEEEHLLARKSEYNVKKIVLKVTDLKTHKVSFYAHKPFGLLLGGGELETEKRIDWTALKGGVAPLPDLRLLEITGHTEQAERIGSRIKTSRTMMWIGGALVVAGLLMTKSEYGPEEEGPGSTLAIAGVGLVIMGIGSLFRPKRWDSHYISAERALEVTHEYNMSLLRTLNLSLEDVEE